MKKKLFIFSFIIAASSSMMLTQSCNKAKELAAFDLKKDMTEHRFDLDSASTAVSAKGESLLYESRFSVNIDSILSANGVENGMIDNGHFTEIEIEIDNPDVLEQFGFLNSVSFRVSTTSDFSESEIVASSSDINKGDTTISLQVNTTSLDHYLTNSVFYFRLYGVLNSPVPVDILPIILRSQIGFTVNPL